MIEKTRHKAGTESMLRPEVSALTYEEARTRKITAEAEIAELELARIRGTLCLTEDVVKAWENVLHACKAKFLSLPTKIAPIVANETDVAIIKDHLESAIREALAELANYQPSIDATSTGSAQTEGAKVEAEKPIRKTPKPRKPRAA